MSNLAKRTKNAIAAVPPQELQVSTTPGAIAPAVTEQQQIIVHVHQPADPRPAHYETMRSRGVQPQELPSFQLPNLLTLTLAATIALLLVVAASMFSISLTAYSNSVDRIDQQRQTNRYVNVQ